MSTDPIGSEVPDGAAADGRRGRGRAGPVVALAVGALLATGCEPATTVDGVNISGLAADDGLAAIDSAAIRARTAFLADDLMEGRAPGTRGGRLAAEYIASEFASLGLEPPADGSYYQSVPILGVTPDPALAFLSDDGRTRFTPLYLEDYVAWTPRQREQVEFSGEVVFVGYGITAPEYDWDDYEGADVEGKVLLGLVNDPGGTGDVEGFRGDTLTYYGRWTYKYEAAARRGAAGMILVHTTGSAGYGWPVVRNSWSGEQFQLPLEGPRPPAVEGWMSEESTRRLLELAGVSLDSLVSAARSRAFTATPLPLRATGRIRSRVRRMDAPNVVAALPGSDSVLRDQVVVYTSHYDHLGVDPNLEGDSIYNGAKDNASGTSTIIEVAEAFAGVEPPRRTVLFAAVTAEESGLLGSRYLGGHPPRGTFVADINMDAVNMYGRTEDIVQLGGDHSSLGETFDEVAGYLGLQVKGDQHPEQGYFFRSDQFSFVNRGVPSLYLEEGLDPAGDPGAEVGERRDREYREVRYHQPADELLPEHTLGGAEQMAEAAFLLGWVVANADSAPTWSAGSPFRRVEREQDARGRGGRGAERAGDTAGPRTAGARPGPESDDTDTTEEDGGG